MGLFTTRNLILLAFLAVTLLPKIQAGELLMSDILHFISLRELRFIKRENDVRSGDYAILLRCVRKNVFTSWR